MAHIGQFTRDKSGFAGRIETLAFRHELSLVPAQRSDAENAPDYRVHLGDGDGPEIGAGWKRTGGKAGEFVSLLIDNPILVQPLRANLFQSVDDKSIWGAELDSRGQARRAELIPCGARFFCSPAWRR